MNSPDYIEYALLGEPLFVRSSRQFAGLPPELTGGVDLRRTMPQAYVLVLMRDTDGSIYLYRFAPDSVVAGDTWRPNIAEAKRQAESEYGKAVADWHPVPVGITDIEAFVRSLTKPIKLVESFAEPNTHNED